MALHAVYIVYISFAKSGN